ncbi:tripartite tricarboxylate transporter substrate binding protein [Cupriavidus basilensis]|uniref:Tripartite tricarboxylate transporter substrate binding protein n=1 Tax=Cupriavidus basilensis TaxID=68895 RepID=A0ABT6B0Q8_9BURK|nr:tripartite tricarboxylate transporter substrate binding protein [Cupriavidus basilensis]MDF3838460.1 tripartite tricarboxylate transporter substrate binding protein [Cupriavidus basilensis]
MKILSFRLHAIRALAALLAGSAIALMAPATAHGTGAWPARGLTLVLPQAAGGGVDTVSRLWAEFATKQLGQPVVVDNRPGAGGAIAVQYVVRQPADGYTLYAASVAQMVLNKFTYKTLPYNPDQDFRGVAMLTTNSFLLVASPQSGIKNWGDLTRLAKAQPAKLNFASAGKGNSTHLVIEMLAQQLGIKLTHVPYQGEAPGLMGVMSGQIDIMAPVLGTGVPNAVAGRVVPLLILGSHRVPQLPNVPTAKEVGLAGFEDIGWLGLAVRTGTPEPVVARLHQITQQFLADPVVVDQLSKLQVDLMPGPAGALHTYIAKDTQRWGRVAKDLGLAND